MHSGMPCFDERFLEVVLVFVGEVAFRDKGENVSLRCQSALGVGEMAPFRSEILSAWSQVESEWGKCHDP